MIRSLQVFRAFAAMLVMVQHVNVVLLEYFDGTIPDSTFEPIGLSGVFFFFTLSGFIIFHAHRHEVLKRNLLPQYFVKRVVRILPIYWIVTLALLPAWLLVPSFGEEYNRSFPALVKSLLLIPQSHYPHLPVGWTLIHEALFYAVFALFFLTRNFNRLLMAWVAAIVIHLIVPSGNWLFEFYLSPLNLLFLIGLGIATNLTWIKANLSGPVLFTAGVAGFVAGIAASLLRLEEVYSNLIFAISSIVLVMASANGGIEKIFEKQRFLVFVGAASYSIYLIHYPIMSVLSKVLVRAEEWVSVPVSLVVVILFTGSLFGGILLHLWVEKPILTACARRIRGGEKPVISGAVVKA